MNRQLGCLVHGINKVVDAGIPSSPGHAKDVTVINDFSAIKHTKTHADDVLSLDGLGGVALLGVPVDNGLENLDEPLVGGELHPVLGDELIFVEELAYVSVPRHAGVVPSLSS